MFQVKSAYWETRPAFLASQFFGVSPFKPNFKLSKLYGGISLIFLFLTVADGLVIFVLMETVNDRFQLSRFSLILERAQLIILMSSVSLSILHGFFNSRPLIQVMGVLTRVDRDLRDVGVFVEYSRHFAILTTCVRLCLVGLSAVFDFSLFSAKDLAKSLILEYIILIPLFVNTLVQIQFMVLIDSVRRRIDTINSSLRTFTNKSQYGKEKKLQVLVVTHSALVEACAIVNSRYCTQILVILSSVFIITTANLYHVIEKILVFLTSSNYNDFNTLCIICFRVFTRSFEVWTLVYTCVTTTDKAKEFTDLFYQILLEDKTNDLITNKKLELHISMKKEVCFSACGFFTLDNTLVHSMIAAATTYLVILIQFSEITAAAPGQPAANATAAPELAF